jgi:hypothetical protein
VKLAKPLEVQLVAGVPELSQLDQLEVDEVPPYFMRVGEEWRGVAADPSTPRDYSNRYCLGSAEEVRGHVFLQWKLGPATPFAGPDTVRIPVRKTTEENDGCHGPRREA